jgi:branched-chain amino acid transport system permease protein
MTGKDASPRSRFLRDTVFGLAGFMILLLMPILFDSRWLMDFVIYVVAYGLLALSLNLLTGYTGLVSFGHAAYFASGAYSFGLLMQSGTVSVPVAFFAALVITAFLALIIGAICVRLTGIYFAFLTLAFQMLFHSVILTWVSLTGGDQGLMGGIPKPLFWGIDLADERVFYTVACTLFVICAFVLRQVTQSPFGYALRMIRDNEERAEFLGVNIYLTKLIGFVIAGMIAGVGGIVLALFVSGAYPDFGFWTTSGEAIFMVMLGGTKTFLGPLVGAIVLQFLNGALTAYTDHSELVLGLVILIAVLGLRRGLLDFADEIWTRRYGTRRTMSQQTTPDGPDPDGIPGTIPADPVILDNGDTTDERRT